MTEQVTIDNTSRVISLEATNEVGSAIFTLGRFPIQTIWALKWNSVVEKIIVKQEKNTYDITVEFDEGVEMKMTFLKSQVTYYEKSTVEDRDVFKEKQRSMQMKELNAQVQSESFEMQEEEEIPNISVKNIRPVTI